ncbi:MAG: hypothetical protein AABW73_00110 [Nanoarchaeota archaeon]
MINQANGSSEEYRKTVDFESFSIEFIVPGMIKSYIDLTGFDLNGYLEDIDGWFTNYLFEVLDWDRDGIPDKEFGKEFQVIIYGIADKIVDGVPYGLMVDIDYDHTSRVFGRAKKERAFDDLVKKMKVIPKEEMSYKPDFQLIEITLRKY